MTDIVGQEKPELLHYGVKGMKWGVRKRNQDIRDARSRLNTKRAKEARKQDKKGKASIALLGEFSPRLSKEYRKDPDRLLAYHMTSGESAVNAMLIAGTMGMALPTTALSVAANQAVKADQRRAVRNG